MVNIFLLIYSLHSYALPQESKKPSNEPTLRMYQVDSEHFRFESCDKNKKCIALGKDEGYTKKELEDWQKFRENTAADILPVIGLVTGMCLFIGAMAFLPLTLGLVGLGAIAGTLGFFLWKTPQVQTGMPNSIYEEFSADPTMVNQLKTFLKEVDEGLVTSEKNPRVFSGKDMKISSKNEIDHSDKSVHPAK